MNALRRRTSSILLTLLLVLTAAYPAAARQPQDPHVRTTLPSPADEPSPVRRLAQAADGDTAFRDPFAADPFAEEETGARHAPALSDPLEPWNRGVFWFNDKVYLYALRPAARGYRAITPRVVRESVRNFFHNLGEPDNAINALLQGRPGEAGRATGRLVINTTAGIGGLFDPAGDYLEPVDRDFDQTFSKWGLPPGPYLVWPLIGPSSVRGTAAYAARAYLTDPRAYIEGEDDFEVTAGLYVLETVNDYSFRLGEYKSMVEHALDPYASLKNLYEQRIHQRSKQ